MKLHAGLFFMEQDEKYIQRTFELARKGIGKVNPNPLVGAVIVRKGQVLGEGNHAYFGGPHAEINAIASAGADVEGSTVYVTLEPCSFYGKTPPCAEELIRQKVARVVLAMKDPNPRVAGKGVKMLRDAGIEVTENVLNNEAMQLNRVFVKFITTGNPYVLMKYAMTLDGKIATHTGDSKWISGEMARKRVHELRNQLRSIMVGVNTVITDNPRLNCRLEGEKRDPVRIVLDAFGRIPDDSLVMQTASEQWTVVVTSHEISPQRKEEIKEHGAEVLTLPESNGMLDLRSLMAELGRMNIDGILLEGGSTLNYSALQSGSVDELIVFVAPKMLGGKAAKTPVEGRGISSMENAIEFEDLNYEIIGNNLMIRGKIKN